MIGPRSRAVAVLLFVFALGLVAGVVFERHRAASAATSRAHSTAEEQAAAMAELRGELGLDDEQLERIHEILAKHHEVVQQSWEQLRPEVQSAMRQVHLEIAALLTPEQRKRFHEWLLRRREASAH